MCSSNRFDGNWTHERVPVSAKIIANVHNWIVEMTLADLSLSNEMSVMIFISTDIFYYNGNGSHFILGGLNYYILTFKSIIWYNALIVYMHVFTLYLYFRK